MRKYCFILLLCVFLGIAYSFFFVNRAHVDLLIDSPQQTYFSIYWSGPDGIYSEKKMARVRIRPGTEKYSFFITDLRRIGTLRIDPTAKPGSVIVKEVVISQPGFEPIRFSNAEEFSQLQPMHDVESARFTSQGWLVNPAGGDPWFQMELRLPSRLLNWFAVILPFLLLLAFFLGVLWLIRPLWHDASYVSYCGIFALGLIMTMAVVTKRDHHPDERVHIAAANYYETNWLPPPVESPEIRDTYSTYGVSRLNTMEVSYFFAGKFAKILKPLQLDPTLTLRLFNVGLFAVLLFLALANPPFRLFFLPMLLSAQVWYIFSYMNSDAFSLFVVMLAGWQIVGKDSVLNRFMEQQKISPFKLLGLGLLLALLVFVKKNFYFFTLFFIFYFLWRFVFQHSRNGRSMAKPLAVLCCIAAVFIGIRVGADFSVNGLDKSMKMRAMQELTAGPLFKPSTDLNKKHIYLQMRDRGTSLEQFIKVERWGEKTFRTAFGAYGYMTVFGPDIYYNIVRWIGLTALLFMASSILVRGGWSGNTLFFGALCCSLALIVTACYHAWTVDFQAQGRYMMAIVAIIGMVLVKTEKVYNQAMLRTLFSAMFFLSVYSFVFVGLFGVAKYGWG